MSVSSQDELPARRRTKSVARLCSNTYDARSMALAETVGTALLVLLSCLPGCAGAPFAIRAAAAGLAVALLVQCFDHISGAMLNPTVLLAAVLAGRVPPIRGALLFVSQAAGAVLGGALVELLAPRPAEGAAAVACLTLPRHDLPVYKAVLIESILGGLLALANMASWDARNRLLTDSWPLRIGLSVAGMSLIAGELTGASMNPMRSFGPALWSARWEHHWVYWAGPLTGSLLCTLAYKRVWAPEVPKPRARAAPSPPSTPPPKRAPRESPVLFISSAPAPEAEGGKKIHYSV